MSNDSLLGMQLDEYRLETLLGKGGMARVYQALDTKLQRYVAIKVIDTPLRADTEYTRRFEREAQAIAKLEYPHIVRLYRYGEAQGLLYMAMQYIEGSDLEHVLRSYRQDQAFIEPAEASRIIREICLTLDFAHSKGVIHRDIKPSNIMLDKQGYAYLTDFGLALLTEIGTRGEIFGSPHYIAPEQAISSAKAVPQSDLYSIGIILYEMFTGQWPFDAENPMDIAVLHMTEDPPTLRNLRPEISPELENVILKAIAKEPDQRYQSGAELANALDIALQGTRARLPADETRRSVPERIEIEHPLPPVPVAVLTPPSQVQPYPVSAPPPVVPMTTPRRQSNFPTKPGIAVGAALGFIMAMVVLFLILGDRDNKSEKSPAVSITERPSDIAVATVNETEESEPSPTSTMSASIPTAAQVPLLTPIAPATQIPMLLPTTLIPTSPTLAPTLTPLVVPSSTPLPPSPIMVPTRTVTTYNILIAVQGEDSVFVINQGSSAFPLAPLQLGNDDSGVEGSDWGVANLAPSECVGVWKDSGRPHAADENCTQVGRLERHGKNRFWRNAFTITYGDQEWRCNNNRCEITISR